MAKYACECCGYRTLDDPPGGSSGRTYQICPVCFWEDAHHSDEEWWCERFSNGLTLREAQRCFDKFHAAGRAFTDAVRPPLPEEARDPNWQTLDERDRAVKQGALDAIADAFNGVTRNGGVSLHETVALDGIGDEPLTPDERTDTGRDWQKVSTKSLAEICNIGGIAFLDPIGYHYIPPGLHELVAQRRRRVGFMRRGFSALQPEP